MTRLLTLSILLLTATAFCGERETIRDATGKVVGTATTSGNRTVYRDATGKTTGTATKDGNRTTYRDATGKTVGTKSRSLFFTIVSLSVIPLFRKTGVYCLTLGICAIYLE